MKRFKIFDAARFGPSIERVIPWCVLAILLTFTYAFFLRVPYTGFSWNSSDSRIFEIYVPATAKSDLHLGDRLIKVGPTLLADFQTDLRQNLFDGMQSGQVMPLIVERDGQLLTVSWIFPGFNWNQLLARLNSMWWLTYAFWVTGTVTLLFVRPKDIRWRLLIAFNFLTAVWLAAGSGVSRWHIWESAFVLRSAIWLCVPIYLHLHWVFPKPLGHLPAFVLWGLYLTAALLAIIEWFQILPSSAYTLGFLLAVSGSAILFSAHFVFRPEQRQNLGRLAVIGILAFIPAILVGLISTLGNLPEFPIFGPLNPTASLVAIPFSYLYATYRRQLGRLELRINRLITLYLFSVLLSIIFIIFVTGISLAQSQLGFSLSITLISVTAALITLLAILGFSPFQRFVERRILDVPWSSEVLLGTYAARITTSLDYLHLIRLLTEEVLPSMLVRQSALLRYDEKRLRIVYIQDMKTDQLPTELDLPALLTQVGKYRVPLEESSLPHSWIRLILPLSIGSELSGLWLLGRRDPDDFYAQAEIVTLQALANQTAIALGHIDYAERLHALYQTSIDQREVERTSLGRELHDNLLQQVLLLNESAAEFRESPPFAKAYQGVVHSLRDLLRGLRPPMLEYGLYRALAALTDDWAYRSEAQGGPVISLAVSETDQRYAPHMELHLYRIVQHAGENALQHAHARNIRIHGCLGTEYIELTVEDDGLGFEVEKLLDLTRPEARGHFGLIGMRERAALINAQIRFDSAPGEGTQVQVIWKPE